MLFVAVLTNICENSLVYFLTPWFEKICREQTDMEARKSRTKKALKNIFKGIYQLSTSILAYVMLKDTYIMPPILGGNGALSDHLKDFPYWEHPPLYTVFYMTCFGYNVAGLVQELFFEDWKRYDFVEMLFHHVVTVYLIGFSFLGSFFIGAPILLIHNASDTLISFTRSWNESKYYSNAFYLFVASVVVWLYTRCFVFPQIVYVSIFQTHHELVPPLLFILFRFCLISLQLLHIYWTFLIFKMIHARLFLGVTDDLIQRNKLSEKDQQLLNGPADNGDEKKKKRE
ncbi:hypothetical protein FGO68_gene12611 [Halteria grandinella]|uniref:TLC domain-containing protein n=1 Tax=Halteria grandinella TaxID=5974 RepID=A0A8J8T1M9_HALGN|nr:hypothetical protein FGO68_gene12611 [Halteria grandinella]